MIDQRMFTWINEVNNILSKKEIGMKMVGDKIESEMDVVLSHLSSNLTMIYTIPQTKMILNNYLKALEKIAMASKFLYSELMGIQQGLQTKQIMLIKVGDEIYYYSPVEQTAFKQSEIKMLWEAYYNMMEAFRRLARRFIYILLSGVDLQSLREEEKPENLYPQFQPIQPPSQFKYPQIPQQGGERQ